MKRTTEQLRASDPGRHIWVSASAGTGKTHVLTDRMLRLMLAGNAPDRILAITFTRAAAAEMQNRLTGRLSAWQTLDDDALDDQLADLGIASSAGMRRRARCLFALALDLPGGLRVQTLHGFAQGLLAGFPLEAGLAAGFRALEERDALLLRRRALQESIAAAARDGDASFLDDLAALAVQKGEGEVSRILDRMIAHWPGMSEFGDAEGLETGVRRLLGIAQDLQPGDAQRETLAPGGRVDRLLADFASCMEAWGTATGVGIAGNARAWLELGAEQRIDALEQLKACIFTTTGQPRSLTNAIRKAPEIEDIGAELADHVGAMLEAELAVENALFASRALRVGHRIAHRYNVLKHAANAVDFDDMIRLSADLLGRPGVPNYVSWKLDSRFDHVLVDEAQDTNELQWRIVRRLVEDYFAAEPDMRERTLFVVGDLKQAIYGFQGTDPQIFGDELARIGPEAVAGGRPIDEVPLNLSFRSGPAVLQVVNAFLGADGWRELGMAEAPGQHAAHRAAAGGEVVLWPLAVPGADDGDDAEPEGDEDDATAEAADRHMADQLAMQIAAWLRPGDAGRLWMPAHERFARPEDILILLRRRSALMGALVAALHRENVPVAGVDRLLLTEPYAVLDLVALVRFAVQPEDDLNLAGLLVSPFIGWTHEEVRAIAGTRTSHLWAELGKAAQLGGSAEVARTWLGDVLRLADHGGPRAFLDIILSGPLDGRRLLLNRLGTEANDAIDELLHQAEQYERANPPALAGFLAWIESEGSEVKRDAEGHASEVRLMTVHGAKGLQSPVVVLADTGHNRRPGNEGWLPVKLDGAQNPVPLFHKGTKSLSGALLADAEMREAKATQEDRRLLYVALTRAADHLFIGGAVSQRRMKQIEEGKSDKSWHSHMRGVFGTIPAAEAVGTRWGVAQRLRAGEWIGAITGADSVAPASALHEIMQVNIAKAPDFGPTTRPLTPSAMPDDPPASPAALAAARRGTLMHRLFERLPGVPVASRHAVALRWLVAQGEDAERAAAIAAEVLTVLAHPDLAEIFTGDALAEAPIAGMVDGRPIAGTVDRLLVTPQRVLVVDFKSGARVPETAAVAPLPYRRQLAIYTRVLAQAFPDRPVQAGLLFTAAPKFLLFTDKELSGDGLLA